MPEGWVLPNGISAFISRDTNKLKENSWVRDRVERYRCLPCMCLVLVCSPALPAVPQEPPGLTSLQRTLYRSSLYRKPEIPQLLPPQLKKMKKENAVLVTHRGDLKIPREGKKPEGEPLPDANLPSLPDSLLQTVSPSVSAEEAIQPGIICYGSLAKSGTHCCSRR